MNGTVTKVLVIRRDNIGDLVCTLPLLRALRMQLPDGFVAALVNRYNAPVLAGQRDVDRVFVYQKAKHRGPGESLAGIYWNRLQMIRELRAAQFDWALLPGGRQASAARLARWVSASRSAERVPAPDGSRLHEVELSCSLLPAMGLRYETPQAQLHPDPGELGRLEARLRTSAGPQDARIVGVHVSARKPSQRWPADRFVEWVDRVADTGNIRFLLLWAPGSRENPRHPGDDEIAASVAGRLKHRRLQAVETPRLETLIAAIALCDHFLCADGGAMHIAAALRKRIVCLFGDSDADRWRPWGVTHELLQTASREVRDITVQDVLAAYERLCARPQEPPVS